MELVLPSLALSLPAAVGQSAAAMLAESWTSAQASAAASSGASPPAFNPAAAEYTELAQRLSRSSVMARMHELSARTGRLKKELEQKGLAAEVRESKAAELEELRGQLTDAQAALSELQDSFEAEPLSLVPWMCSLFELADAGATFFDTGGAGWPPPAGTCAGGVAGLLAPSATCAPAGGPAALSGWLFGGAERVLGAFKRRYEAERGPGRLTIATRLALGAPGDDSGGADMAAAVQAGVERSRVALLGVGGAAAGGALDLVLLEWLGDHQSGGFLAALAALARLTRPQAAPGTDGGLEVAGPPVLRGLGLVNPPAAALTAALRAGVPLAGVALPFSLLDASRAPVVQQARAAGLAVLAEAPLAHGLIADAWLGRAAPDAAAAGGAGSACGAACDNLVAALGAVARYGGWARFQTLLQALRRIADKHGRAGLADVALRWVADAGASPLVGARVVVGGRAGSGALRATLRRGCGPATDAAAADAPLAWLAGESWLDEADAAELAALAGGGTTQ